MSPLLGWGGAGGCALTFKGNAMRANIRKKWLNFNVIAILCAFGDSHLIFYDRLKASKDSI